MLSIPVRYEVPEILAAGGKGTSFKFALNVGSDSVVSVLISPVAPMTSHLSLQYAVLTPSPLITPARNSALHTPVVCWVQVLSQLPLRSKSAVVRELPVTPMMDDVAKFWHVAPSLAPSFQDPATPFTVRGPPPPLWAQVMYSSMHDAGPQSAVQKGKSHVEIG